MENNMAAREDADLADGISPPLPVATVAPDPAAATHDEPPMQSPAAVASPTEYGASTTTPTPTAQMSHQHSIPSTSDAARTPEAVSRTNAASASEQVSATETARSRETGSATDTASVREPASRTETVSGTETARAPEIGNTRETGSATEAALTSGPASESQLGKAVVPGPPGDRIPDGKSGGIVARIRAYLLAFTDLSPNARRLLFATMAFWVGIGASGVLFNLYLIALGYNVAFVGLIGAVSTVGQAGASPLMSGLLRRYSARNVMMVSTVLIVLGLTLSALLSNAFLLIVVTAILGAAVAAASIPASPFIMEQTPAHLRSQAFSAYSAANTIGSMLGSLLGGSAATLAGLVAAWRGEALPADRLGLLIGAGISVVGVWMFWTMTTERSTTSDQPLRPGPLTPVVTRDEDEVRRDVLNMMGATALIAIAMGSIYPLFNVYFQSQHHASPATIGVLYATSGLLCTIGAFLGPAAARWGALAGLASTRALTIPIFVLFWANPGLGLAMAAYVSRNVLGTIAGALENTFCMEVVPSRLRGTVASWRAFSFNAGWTLGSLVAGLVVARFGFDPIFIVSATFTTAGVLVWRQRFGHSPAAVKNTTL